MEQAESENPVEQADQSQMVPKMEGSPTEHIKMEHQVPQSSNPNTSLSSGQESLIGVPSSTQAWIKNHKKSKRKISKNFWEIFLW